MRAAIAGWAVAVPLAMAGGAWAGKALAAESDLRLHCVPAKLLAEALHQEGKTPRTYGLANSGGLIEWYAAPDGLWAIIVRLPGFRDMPELGCELDRGSDFEQLLPAPAGGGS